MSKEVVDWISRNSVALSELSDSIYNEGYDDGAGIDECRDEGALGRFHGDLLDLAGKDDAPSLRRKTVVELIRYKKPLILEHIQDAFEDLQSVGYYTDEDTYTLYDSILDLFIDVPDDAVVSVGNVTVECNTVSELIAAKEADVRDIVRVAYEDGIASYQRTFGVNKDDSIGRAVAALNRLFSNSVIHPVIKEIEVVRDPVSNITHTDVHTDMALNQFKDEAGKVLGYGIENYEVDSVSVPVMPNVEGERDILRAVIRSAYLDGYVSGARGADASDYDVAESAIDNLFAVMKSRQV